MEILELKDAITKIKNSVHGFNCMLDTDEKRINDLKDRSV